VCFPQFGQLGPLGQHGFARNSAFTVAEETDDSVTLVRCYVSTDYVCRLLATIGTGPTVQGVLLCLFRSRAKLQQQARGSREHGLHCRDCQQRHTALIGPASVNTAMTLCMYCLHSQCENSPDLHVGLFVLQVLKASGSEDPKYPRPFELKVKVQLGDNSLQQELAVTNTGVVTSHNRAVSTARGGRVAAPCP
jgi:hypothetical protein